MLPDNAKAQYVTAQIRRLGVKDIQLFYDHQTKLWALCQVKQIPRTIIILDNASGSEIQPQILWWIRTPKGSYRPPGEQDVNDVMAMDQRRKIIAQKSKSNPNWLDDQMLEAERVKTEKHQQHQDEKLRYAIRHFKVQDDIRKNHK